jgi:hypothetical protein
MPVRRGGCRDPAHPSLQNIHRLFRARRLEHAIALLAEDSVQEPAGDASVVHHQDRCAERGKWSEHRTPWKAAGIECTRELVQGRPGGRGGV